MGWSANCWPIQPKFLPSTIHFELQFTCTWSSPLYILCDDRTNTTSIQSSSLRTLCILHRTPPTMMGTNKSTPCLLLWHGKKTTCHFSSNCCLLSFSWWPCDIIIYYLSDIFYMVSNNSIFLNYKIKLYVPPLRVSLN